MITERRTGIKKERNMNSRKNCENKNNLKEIKNSQMMTERKKKRRKKEIGRDENVSLTSTVDQ